MANSQRRYKDQSGNTFLPMNVEGGSGSTHFITTPKLITIVVSLLGTGFIIAYLYNIEAEFLGWVIYLGGFLLIALYALRYIVFEEKFYYKMYKEKKGKEITTPAIFWYVASIKDADDGALITYADGKVGMIIKLDRDTITGKEEDFEETHYDAISDFYRSLLTKKYSYMYMNIMEVAGKDPRLFELDALVSGCNNSNVKKLVELQVGHIKNIAQSTLYESDYYLIYTNDISKVDTMAEDIADSAMKILDGAYVGYKMLSRKDLIDIEKNYFGVNYFNYTEASLNMYSQSNTIASVPFSVTGIVWDTDEKQDLDNGARNRLRNLTSCVINETAGFENISIKEAIYVGKEKTKVGVDFSSLGSITNTNHNNTINNQSRPAIYNDKSKPVRPNPTPLNSSYKNNMNSLDAQANSLLNQDWLNSDEDLIDL